MRRFRSLGWDAAAADEDTEDYGVEKGVRNLFYT